MNITDPIEKIVAEALDRAGVRYTHESTHPIEADFHLLAGTTFIKCKQFYSRRGDDALRRKNNIILIQGRKAAETFAKLIGGES